MTRSGSQLREGSIIVGSLFNEPMRVETARASGDGTWTVGLVGAQSERFRKVTLSTRDLDGLTVLDAGFTYDGDGRLLRLGLQAYSLGIVWEFDPYFSLSISLRMTFPELQEPIKDPPRFPWHEVSKGAYCWLEVDAMTKPMIVQEEQSPYGREKS
jgi:hypothetical protein